jgi:hypothetical protein
MTDYRTCSSCNGTGFHPDCRGCRKGKVYFAHGAHCDEEDDCERWEGGCPACGGRGVFESLSARLSSLPLLRASHEDDE